MGMTMNGAWPFAQILNPVSTQESTPNLVKIGQEVSGLLFNNIMIIIFIAQGHGKITLAE